VDVRRYIEVFSREAEEHLQCLRDGLLRLEKDGFAAPLVHEILRSAHTIKGSAGLLDMGKVVQVAHRMEDILKEVEEETRPLDSELIDILLMGADTLEALVAEAVAGEADQLDIAAVMEALREGRLGARPTPVATPGKAEKQERGDMVRASVARLDQIGNLVGELVIQRRFLEERTRQTIQLHKRQENFLRYLRKTENLKTAKGIADDLRSLSIEMDRDLLNLTYLSRELQQGTMELRMLPLGTITGELVRMVRDLARELGKEATLEVVGEEVELDRSMLETAKPMLLHLLRNSVDHGIETPEDRRKAGKPAAGKIQLTARYERGFVQLLLRDDGRGIDPNAVRRVAAERRVMTAAEAEMLTDREAVYLILRPGFTTREFITDVSGRGIGMDVVKDSIDRVKGNLTIESVPGRGTDMHLQLPLSLAVITGLVFECENQIYAIPLNYVAEVLRLSAADILLEGGREVVRAAGTTLPLFSLAEVFGQSAAAVRRMTALALHFQGRQAAFLVSRSLGVQELVVRGLGSQLKRVEFVSGATILGDGSPALILSVADLFGEGALGAGSRHKAQAAPSVGKSGRILVVDDSITTRTMERNILEARGYQVTVAVSGPDALDKLAANAYDLIVSDVEMPGMTGFELTREVRRNERTRAIPVIIVTSLAADEDRRQGMEVGAQAYIVKGGFDQGVLLETVETLIG